MYRSNVNHIMNINLPIIIVVTSLLKISTKNKFGIENLLCDKLYNKNMYFGINDEVHYTKN